MSAISFTGLASGLDSGALIDQLVAAERAKADLLTRRQSDLDAQKSIVSSLTTALASLGTLARGMDLASEVQPLTATLSDAHLSVAVSSSAATGTHDLRVKQMAVAKVVRSKGFSSNVAGILGNGGVNITVKGVTKSVTWGNSDTLDTIASKINGADAGVTASVVFDGSLYRLMVRSDETGTAAAATFADTGPGANRLDLAAAGNVITAAKDAIVNVDGLDVTRATNVISDVLPGVTLTLNSVHATADPNAKLTVSLDQKALIDKVKALVAAYNTVNAALHVQLDYTGTPKGANTLFGDSTLRQLQVSLGSVTSNAYGGSNLGALGITRDKSGAMTLDETKLAAALTSDPAAVANVFVTGGFATAVGDLADLYTTSGTGIFATKTQGLTDRRKVLQQQIDRITLGADALQARLEKQFNALEKAIAGLQSQTSYLAGLLK